MIGGSDMMVNMRNKKNNKLVSKDILDINLNMSVSAVENGFRVSMNKQYYLDEYYSSEQDAEDAIKNISLSRNLLENELKMYES